MIIETGILGELNRKRTRKSTVFAAVFQNGNNVGDQAIGILHARYSSARTRSYDYFVGRSTPVEWPNALRYLTSLMALSDIEHDCFDDEFLAGVARNWEVMPEKLRYHYDQGSVIITAKGTGAFLIIAPYQKSRVGRFLLCNVKPENGRTTINL